MAAQGDLVPITRDFLKKWVEPLEVPPLSNDFNGVKGELDTAVTEASTGEGKALKDKLTRDSPKKIEENLFRCREQCELIAEVMKPSPHANKEFLDIIHTVFVAIETFQNGNTERVRSLVADFMPKDFRANMVAYQHERSEKHKKEEVETLLSKGGSIQDKYNLLWSHQLNRREKLVALGQASGVWKAIVKMVAGVPQVLLDFIKTINDDLGPVEEIRVKCAPPLYDLRLFLNTLHTYTALIVAGHAPVNNDLLLRAATTLNDSFKPYLEFLTHVFATAPWFVTAAELAKTMGGGELDYTKVNVGAGSKHDVVLDLQADCTLGYEFRTEANDIGFCIVGPSGSKVVNDARHDCHLETVKGTVPIKTAGKYTLRWDNSFSFFTGKVLLFRTSVMDDVTPNVTSP